MIPVVEDTAIWFDQRLRAIGDDPEQFSSLAAAALRVFHDLGGLTLEQLMSRLVLADYICGQQDLGANFAQPPITLYNDPKQRFFLAAYMWVDRDISIHDHGFRGAFSVLSGTCQHSTYSFDAADTQDGASLGKLAPRESNELIPSDIVPIAAGHAFIHRNEHVSSPTLTVILRSYGDSAIKQSHYLEPGVALTTDFSELAIRRNQVLRSLLRVDVIRGLELVCDLARESASPAELYEAMQLLYLAGGPAGPSLVAGVGRQCENRLGRDLSQALVSAVNNTSNVTLPPDACSTSPSVTADSTTGHDDW